MEHTHSNDKLYPRSVYRCTECGTFHRTRPFGGAVNWQCPNELVKGVGYHQSAKQEYVGYLCWCNEVIDLRQNSNGFVNPEVREALR